MATTGRTRTIFLAPLVSALLIATSSAVASTSSQDPLESFNRKIYTFNDKADTYVLRPLAQGYRAVTPQPVERSISRAFANLLEVNSAFNSVLQAKFGKAARHSGRFVLNSTLGIAGFIEVAEPIGLPRIDGEDFGQTLAVWGVRSGPYLVLPLLGSSTLRDAPSRYVDSFLDPVMTVDHVPTRNTIRGVDLLSTRAQLLEAEQLISGDPYVFMREIYFQRRAYLISDGDMSDDFGDDFDSFDDQDADSNYDF